jgi:hypothetical protein
MSVDVVNASGIVGHHLDEHTGGLLVAELMRVIVAQGIAMLDVGPSLSDRTLTKLMADAGFQRLGHWTSWWLDPTGQVVYRRQASL